MPAPDVTVPTTVMMLWLPLSPPGPRGVPGSLVSTLLPQCSFFSCSEADVKQLWLQLKKERQLPGTVYSLRHTFISMMKNVMPEQMIKDICGHSISMDTFGTYGHIIDGESHQAASIIDLTFGQNLGQNESASGGHEVE